MSQFVDYLHEVFAEFGPIRHRKMFGGYGIYHDDLMFALVADDELYLKVDDESKHLFEEADLPAFEYSKNGKLFNMSYHKAPEAIFDDREFAAEWASMAFAAALRGKVNAQKRTQNKAKSKKT